MGEVGARRRWPQCGKACDIGDAPQAEHLPLTPDQCTAALTAWAMRMAVPAPRQTLANAALGYLLETLGVLAGERLGLEGLSALTFGAWLATRLTGCAPLLESPEVLAALDQVALAALREPPHPLWPASTDAPSWRRYRPAIPAIVATLRAGG